MDEKYILGVKGIADFFGLPLQHTAYLLQNGGIPGVRKLKRQSNGMFPGGGRGVWALQRTLAERYKFTRKQTPPYEPVRATEALLTKFSWTGASSIPELIELGVIDDYDWCEELNRQREISNLHVPILMHPIDLQQFLGLKTIQPVTKRELYPQTTEIFKPARRRRGKNGTG